MLEKAYRQIWRPCASDDYCTSSHFAVGFFEICDGYASAENALRSALNRYGSQSPNECNMRLYTPLKAVIFEIQDCFMKIMKANQAATVHKITGKEIAKLEKPMKLSEYTCTALVNENECSFRPYASLPCMGEWYLEGANAFFAKSEHKKRATLENLLCATAALRCLVYAQFGCQSELAIYGNDKKGEGEGYFTASSIFTVIPPKWTDEECYGFHYDGKEKLETSLYPFS
ncbi:MAG: hypothetical protein RRZ42_08060 [Oscillospiraceae bacterium]